MENGYPLPDEEKADLDIINALKAMKPVQKNDILSKIAELHNTKKESKIDFSSAANQEIHSNRQKED